MKAKIKRIRRKTAEETGKKYEIKVELYDIRGQGGGGARVFYRIQSASAFGVTLGKTRYLLMQNYTINSQYKKLPLQYYSKQYHGLIF
jgi:hypothetical protein